MIRSAVNFAAAVLFAATTAPAAAQPEKPVSIVLVHGAFVDASGWERVYDILTRDGFEVLMVQNATDTLDGDVATTERVIAAARHPVVLVGHSYGGAVITEAGNDPKVKGLVYLAAFAPDRGETVAGLNDVPTPGEPKAPLLPPQGGHLLVDPAKFPSAFAADVDPTLTRFMAVAQLPWGLPAVQTKIGNPAWRTKPTSFMVTQHDFMIPPSAQRTMAKRTGGKIAEIASSHAVMLAHPQEVAAFITAAAETK